MKKNDSHISNQIAVTKEELEELEQKIHDWTNQALLNSRNILSTVNEIKKNNGWKLHVNENGQPKYRRFADYLRNEFDITPGCLSQYSKANQTYELLINKEQIDKNDSLTVSFLYELQRNRRSEAEIIRIVSEMKKAKEPLYVVNIAHHLNDAVKDKSNDDPLARVWNKLSRAVNDEGYLETHKDTLRERLQAILDKLD